MSLAKARATAGERSKLHEAFFGSKGYVKDSEGKTLQKFKFNDSRDAQKSNFEGPNATFSRVNFNFESRISDVTENATKEAPSKGIGKYKWIYKESLGVGKLDYQSSEILPGGAFSGGAYELYFAGGRVYNKADAGNFLWGRSMKLLKVNYLIVKAASEFNGFYNGRVQNNGVSRNGGTVKQGFSFKRITWQGDTRADQRAIRRGYRGQFNSNSTNENSNENIIPSF